MSTADASARDAASGMTTAPQNGDYILVFDRLKGWVKAKWVEHAQMFSVEDPDYQCRFFPVKNPIAWQPLPDRPCGKSNNT